MLTGAMSPGRATHVRQDERQEPDKKCSLVVARWHPVVEVAFSDKLEYWLVSH